MNARKNFRTRPKENIIANITPPPCIIVTC